MRFSVQIIPNAVSKPVHMDLWVLASVSPLFQKRDYFIFRVVSPHLFFLQPLSKYDFLVGTVNNSMSTA